MGAMLKRKHPKILEITRLITKWSTYLFLLIFLPSLSLLFFQIIGIAKTIPGTYLTLGIVAGVFFVIMIASSIAHQMIDWYGGWVWKDPSEE